MVRINVLNDCLRSMVNAERKGKRQVSERTETRGDESPARTHARPRTTGLGSGAGRGRGREAREKGRRRRRGAMPGFGRGATRGSFETEKVSSKPGRTRSRAVRGGLPPDSPFCTNPNPTPTRTRWSDGRRPREFPFRIIHRNLIIVLFARPLTLVPLSLLCPFVDENNNRS